MMKQEAQPVLNEISPAATTPIGTAVPDRRRSGRSIQVSPYLIPLLRDTANAEIVPASPALTDASDLAGDLAPIVGIIVSAGLSLTLWTILIRVGLWILH